MNVLRLYIERKTLKVQRPREQTMKWRPDPFNRFRPQEACGDTKGIFDFYSMHLIRKPTKLWGVWYSKEHIGTLRYDWWKKQ